MLSSPVDEIKSRIDVVELIGSYIKLQKAGVNYRAPCPFHSEKKPSFFVSPARQIWHCFGCGAGNSIFDFVMKIEGVEFGDALRILARKAGVELKKQDPKLMTERRRLYEICESAARFFQKQIESGKAGIAAKNYLLGRGINEDSIKKWRAGYSPETWQGLSDFLVGRGYKREEIKKAGLAVEDEKGHFYDRFRGRIMFPIFDFNSQVVGFGGRIFKKSQKADKAEDGTRNQEDIAKYINTPNTLLYDKSWAIYGLDKAKMAIRKKDGCILVEGYTDAIMSHQAGVENVIAVSGTALTNFQLKILKRYSENLLIAFDMDIAGDSATKRGIGLAIDCGFNVKVVGLPSGEDPADVILRAPEHWQKAVAQPNSITEFYFINAFAGFDKNTAEGKKRISQVILPALKIIPNKIEQAHWIQRLAKELEIKEEDIETELKKIRRPDSFYRPVSSASEQDRAMVPPKSGKELMEERILSLVLRIPSCLSLIKDEHLNYFSPLARQVLSRLKETNNTTWRISLASSDSSCSPQLANFLNCLLLQSEIEEEADPEQEIQICLKNLSLLERKTTLNLLAKEIQKAEQEKNSAKIKELIEEFSKLSKELVV